VQGQAGRLGAAAVEVEITQSKCGHGKTLVEDAAGPRARCRGF
jgi:hypothetical protein